jgi:hypothetical protein
MGLCEQKSGTRETASTSSLNTSFSPVHAFGSEPMQRISSARQKPKRIRIISVALSFVPYSAR